MHSGGVLQSNGIALRMYNLSSQQKHQLRNVKRFTNVCELAIFEYQEIVLGAKLLQTLDERELKVFNDIDVGLASLMSEHD